jgi:hypothetical protein
MAAPGAGRRAARGERVSLRAAVSLAAGAVAGAAANAARPHWLPAGKLAAVCFSVDDVHPSSTRDGCDAGGDLGAGALGRLAWLQQRHRDLKVTLCVTPDWRLDSLVADTAVLRHVPWLRWRVHWTRVRSAGHFRIDRFPEFVGYLNGLERCEVVPHGLHHAHVGPRFAVEFQEQTERQCLATLGRALEIFGSAGLKFVPGFVPPAWHAPPALIAALSRLDVQFLSAARDLDTPVTRAALTAHSGLTGVSLIYPELVGAGRLVHLSCNFQATSPVERAVRILELGGVLHVKAHIFKSGKGHVMSDGLDQLYCNYLDLLFDHLSARFGAALWWPHLSEIARRVRTCHGD